MILGFTGTQEGMTEEQKTTFRHLVKTREIDEFHHGMCVGSDAQAHGMVVSITDAEIHGYPASMVADRVKARCNVDVLHEARRPLVRNQDIVDAVEKLVATPKEHHEIILSGTWATVRRAVEKGIPILVIWPDGKTERWDERD